MSVRSIEAEVSIKSGVQAECTIGREVIRTIYEEPTLESLAVVENGTYEPSGDSDGFSDVTVNVPERYPGGFNPFAHGTRFHEFFRRVDLPENIVIDFEGNSNVLTLESMFLQSTGIRNITIKNLVCENPISFNSFLYRSTVETLTFENCTIRPSAMQSFGRYCGNLVNVFGEIDCSGCSSSNSLYYLFAMTPKLKHFRFKQNSISQSLIDFAYHNSNPIDDDSWISVANALNPEVQKSINLKSNNRIVCSNILGDNDNGLFVKNINGTMNLVDFITNIKGWTIVN